jgi:hypothetical protein
MGTPISNAQFMKQLGASVRKFVQPLHDALKTKADNQRVGELQNQITELKASLLLCERSVSAHKRHLQALEKKLGLIKNPETESE